MSYIVVYMSTGEVIDFTHVIDRRRVWRRVSKACKRWASRVDHVIELRGINESDLNALFKIGEMARMEVALQCPNM